MSMNASFSDLYMQYAVSHIIPAMSTLAMTLLLTELSTFSAKYVFVTTTWHVWIAVILWMFSPWFFHPQSFKEGVPAINFTSWLFWLDPFKLGNQGRSQSRWHLVDVAGQAYEVTYAPCRDISRWSTSRSAFSLSRSSLWCAVRRQSV